MAILTTIYLLNAYQSPLRTDLYELSIRDTELPARLERAERVYSKVVEGRKEMIRKFGPTPRDVHMYANYITSLLGPNLFLSGSHKTRNRGHRILSVSASVIYRSPESFVDEGLDQGAFSHHHFIVHMKSSVLGHWEMVASGPAVSLGFSTSQIV